MFITITAKETHHISIGTECFKQYHHIPDISTTSPVSQSQGQSLTPHQAPVNIDCLHAFIANSKRS